jgi:hypothetical protein
LVPIETAKKAKPSGLELGPEPTIAVNAVTRPFDFRQEPPRAYRPFKTRTHVAMGKLSNCSSTGPGADSWGYRNRKSSPVGLDPDGLGLS